MTDPRKRAARLSVDERRAMIIATTVPLLVELGPSVSTLQIAEAAGISEPTIFRAFVDKNELLAACLEDVTDSRYLVHGLNAISAGAPLHERVAVVIDTVRAQGARIGAVAAASSHRSRRDVPDEQREALARRRTESFEGMTTAIAAVLAPGDALRLNPERAAKLILHIVLALGRNGSWETGPMSVTTPDLADLIVRGVAAH